MRHILTLDIHSGAPSDEAIADEFKRVADMIADGFTSGEITGQEGDDSTFNGWWDVCETE
jgi:hypothetical protein